jgi:hypothetical protein
MAGLGALFGLERWWAHEQGESTPFTTGSPGIPALYALKFENSPNLYIRAEGRFSKRDGYLSETNPDIREQVEANRGALKKLQLLIPGLRGYRTKEDIRVSDELLRNQVADRMDKVKGNLEQLRRQVASAGDLANLTGVGSLIVQVQTMSGEIRHAAQGYAGWVAPITVNEDKLNKLYEYDYSFVSSVMQLDESTSPENLRYDTSSPNSVQATLGELSKNIGDIREKWSMRMETIEGIALR